jgi:PilZ domain-containing protein
VHAAPRMPENQLQKAEASQRRTERVMLRIPIRVLCFGGSAGDFSEDTYTLVVNRDGALIALKHRLAPGDTVRIINLENLREADFRVVGTTRAEGGDVCGWGVECLDKERTLWDIDFPAPSDFQSEDAGALLECQGCRKQALLVLSMMEVEMLESAGKLERLCNPCGELSSWVYADLERHPKKLPPQAGARAAPEPSAKWDGKTERRLQKRVALKLPALVRNHKGVEEIGKTENISKGGLGLCLGMELGLDERVTVMCPYSADGQTIEQKAEVRRRVVLYAGKKWFYGLRYIS